MPGVLAGVHLLLSMTTVQVESSVTVGSPVAMPVAVATLTSFSVGGGGGHGGGV